MIKKLTVAKFLEHFTTYESRVLYLMAFCEINKKYITQNQANAIIEYFELMPELESYTCTLHQWFLDTCVNYPETFENSL